MQRLTNDVRAENDRLREALERIANGQRHSDWPDFARAVLASSLEVHDG